MRNLPPSLAGPPGAAQCCWLRVHEWLSWILELNRKTGLYTAVVFSRDLALGARLQGCEAARCEAASLEAARLRGCQAARQGARLQRKTCTCFLWFWLVLMATVFVRLVTAGQRLCGTGQTTSTSWGEEEISLRLNSVFFSAKPPTKPTWKQW